MIFVNDGAGGYWWLEHATWNGLAAGDLVFPAFLWIMGVCIPLSVKSAFAKGVPRWKIVLQIIRVSILIILLKIELKYLILIHNIKLNNKFIWSATVSNLPIEYHFNNVCNHWICIYKCGNRKLKKCISVVTLLLTYVTYSHIIIKILPKISIIWEKTQ